MSIHVGINGYARIGRNTLRALFDAECRDEIEIVADSDLGDAEIYAHLTRCDDTHAPFRGRHTSKLDHTPVEEAAHDMVDHPCQPRSRSVPQSRTTPWRGITCAHLLGRRSVGGTSNGIPGQQWSRGRIHLLVVRLADYGRAELCLLPGVDRDAAALVDALDACSLRPLQYRNVLCDGEATRANIVNELEQIKASAGSDDQVLIVLLGHVVREDNHLLNGSRPYFLAFDSDPSLLASSGLDFELLASYVMSFAAREVIVLVDTCYAGALPQEVLHAVAQHLPANAPGYLNRKSIFIGASAEEHQLAFDSDSGGMMVPALAAALRGDLPDVTAGDPITIQQAFLHAARIMGQKCAQLRINQRPTHVSVGSQIEVTRKPVVCAVPSRAAPPPSFERRRGTRRDDAPSTMKKPTRAKRTGKSSGAVAASLSARFSIDLRALLADVPPGFRRTDELVAFATNFNLLLTAVERDVRT